MSTFMEMARRITELEAQVARTDSVIAAAHQADKAAYDRLAGVNAALRADLSAAREEVSAMGHAVSRSRERAAKAVRERELALGAWRSALALGLGYQKHAHSMEDRAVKAERELAEACAQIATLNRVLDEIARGAGYSGITTHGATEGPTVRMMQLAREARAGA